MKLRIKEYYDWRIGQVVFVVQKQVRFLWIRYWYDNFKIHTTKEDAIQEVDAIKFLEQKRLNDSKKPTKYYEV